MSDKNNTFIDLTKQKVKAWGSRIVIDIPDKANLNGKILRIGLKGKTSQSISQNPEVSNWFDELGHLLWLSNTILAI